MLDFGLSNTKNCVTELVDCLVVNNVPNGSHKINLIFAADLSTKDQISDVSGRGVGMDAVKSILADLGAQIEVSSEVGKGTTFTIKFPGTSVASLNKAA